jgi:hypothetical protein
MNGSDYLPSFDIEMIGKHYYLYHGAIKQANPFLPTAQAFLVPKAVKFKTIFSGNY